MSGLLAGRRTLLVGAGSGIGRAVVDAFLAEGALVSVLERDPAKCDELRAVHDVRVTTGDATSTADVSRAVDISLDAFGGLDVLACFVGVFDYYRPLMDLTEEQLDAGFDEAYRINVKSTLVSSRACVPALRASRGTIILTASTSSFAAGRGGILYVGTKFAVRGTVLALAHELAPEVRVNAVAPGGTLGTDLRGLEALGESSRSLGATTHRAESVAARSRLGVALDGSDIAASYVFLASDGARGMTGRFLHPDGGASIR